MYAHRLIALAGLVLGAIALACTAPPPAVSPPATVKPGATAAATAPPRVELAAEIRMGFINLADNFEPHVAASPFTVIPTAQWSDGLTQRSPEGRLEGALAQSWRAIDNQTWEFKLKPNVKFHDGTTVAASDVKFTVERIVEPANQVPIADRLEPVASVETPDPSTVIFRMKRVDAIFPARLTDAKIVPEQAFKEKGVGGFTQAPVGTGPWKVKEFRPNQFMQFEAFDSWRGRPATGLARLIKIPENASLVAAIRTDEIDIAYDVPVDLRANLQATGTIELIPFVRTSSLFMDMNYIQFDEFKDKRVRHALNFAVDKEAVNRAASGGLGVISPGQLVPAGITGHNPALTAYPFDLERARQLMREAGSERGFTSRVLTVPGNNAIISQAVGGFLERVNVRLELDQREFPTYLQMYLQGQKGPMMLWGTGYGNIMDADAPLTFFMGNQRPQIRRMDNEEFTRVMAQSKVELDPARRERLLQEAAAIMREEAPGIFLYQQGYLVAHNKKVQGFSKRADDVIRLDQVTRIR